MCSIPGCPSPGLETSVLITGVNLKSSHGLLEFWVNTEDGRKHIYEQMREEIQTPQSKFNGSEGKPGDLCIVCINDTWNRARIVSIQGETYNVFLIDQGQAHSTTSEALAWSKSDSFLLPPEVESCILANVIFLQKEWPETITKFLMCLPGKKFKALVQDVLMPDRIILLEIPVLSNYMCKLKAAKKIEVDQFHKLVKKCLKAVKEELSESFCLTMEPELEVSCNVAQCDRYFFPELTMNTYEMVRVTEVIDPLKIFCMLLIFSNSVNLLSEQIQQHYEEGSDFGQTQPQSCGDPCAAKGTDGKWHRSLLKQDILTGQVAIEDDVEVFHVDEGKTEMVKAENIRPLHGKFLKMPVVTYLCSLNKRTHTNREEAADETADVKSKLLNQTVVVRFDHYNELQDIYYITLHAGNAACVKDILLGKTVPILFSESEQNVNVQNDASLVPVLFEGKEVMDLCSETNETDGLHETWPSTKLQVDNSCEDDSSTSGICNNYVKGNSLSVSLLHSNGDLSSSLPSEVQNACDDGVFAVGKTVNVKVSCIESPQKFWCQATESANSLRQLMEDLQAHYASAHPQPLVDTICVARNPDNKMWYRARIVAGHDIPTVDVRFIDYGQTQNIPLRDVLPIDPVFLHLEAQAFQCCLFSLENSIESTPSSWPDAQLTEFLKFVNPGTSSDAELKCVVKAVTSDEDGLLLNLVDIQRESESVCKLLAQKCALFKAQEQVSSAVSLDGCCYSTHSTEISEEEKVLITSSETVNHFYCQLHRNSHILDRLMKNIEKLLDKPQGSDHHTLELNSLCFARHTNNQWYRGQIVEMSPKLKVHFIDYGDTHPVLKSDICPFPLESNAVRCVPVQVIPMALFDMPADLPQDVNQWFADFAVGRSFMISVVAQSEEGKLIIELFDGPLNVNMMVREKVEKMKLDKMISVNQTTDQHLSNSAKAALPNGGCSTQDLNSESTLNTTEQKKDTNKDTPPQMEQVEDLGTVAETFSLRSHSNLEMAPQSSHACPEVKGKIYRYKWPSVSQNLTVDAFASCIVGPNHFWCQYTSTDELKIISKFAEGVGQDVVSPEKLEPGSPCLALFSSDNLWYRAQVIKKTDETVKVLFVDYGNETEISISNVKSLPYSLLEIPPQAFLCCLNGFNMSSGSWDDRVHDEFSNLLVNKQLKVTICDLENDSEIAIPRYIVNMECDKQVINKIMQKYWKSFPVELLVNNVSQTNISPPSIQTESNINYATRENIITSIYHVPEMFESKTKMVYASCISETNFFWCQFANTEDLNNVSQLAHEAGQTEEDLVFSRRLGPGNPCLALFPSDNQWYRAQVRRTDEEKLHVLFVDYGNESEVDFKNVRPLTQSLLEMAPQAFLCCLSGFDESKGSWEDDAYDVFYNYLVDKPLKLTVCNMRDHSETAIPQYSVKIKHEGININAAMQKYWKPVTEETSKTKNQKITSLHVGPDQADPLHLCVSSKTLQKTGKFKELVLSKDQTEMVYASCISELNYFWCQFANTEDVNYVSQLAQEAGQTEQDLVFSRSLGPGSPCLALFPSDNQWYRAQVLRTDEEKLHVLFVDYGNESEADFKNVRPLTQSLLEMTPQAFLCCLSGFDESKGSWEDEAYNVFYNFLVDEPLRLTIGSMGDHSETAIPQYSVEIKREGININAAMQKYWKPVAEESSTTQNQKSTSLNVGPDHNDPQNPCVSKKTLQKSVLFKELVLSKDQTEMVFASCISEPCFFWCQFANTEDVNYVSQLAQEAGQAEQDLVFSRSLGPGSRCLALFPSDNQWYRAQVLRTDEEKLHVLFVDYGNESEADFKNVRPLTQSLLEITPQAFLCCLSGFDESKGSWEDEAFDVFYNCLVDKPLKLTVCNMRDHSETAIPQYSVEIKHEGININAAMQKYWKPVTEESSTTQNQKSTSLNVGPDYNDPQNPCVSKKTLQKSVLFKELVLSKDQTEMVFASCISEPCFFWCQFANTEDLNNVSQLAQEAGQTEEDLVFSRSLGPGSPCLALFPSDNQWYRAQVLHTDEEKLHVLFVDYGNESEVDFKNVRPLTQSLLEMAPQAFLCCLSGFDEFKGSWEDDAYDVFYNCLVDKPLKLTIGNTRDHLETAVTQYSVKIEQEGMVVNMLMEKYWITRTSETVDQDESLTIDKTPSI